MKKNSSKGKSPKSSKGKNFNSKTSKSQNSKSIKSRKPSGNKGKNIKGLREKNFRSNKDSNSKTSKDSSFRSNKKTNFKNGKVSNLKSNMLRNKSSQKENSRPKSMNKFNKSHQRRDQEEQSEQQKGNANPNHIDKIQILDMNETQQLNLIRETYDKITLSPEQHIKQIETVFILSKVDNVKVVLTAIQTLAQIFANVAPLQAVSMKDVEKRMAVTITKDQLKVIKFQKILVQQYERYIKILRELNTKLKKNNFQNNLQLYRQFKKCVMDCCQKCFDSLWHFNGIKQLLDVYVKFYTVKQCRNSINQFLSQKNIATMPIKSKLISSLAQLITKKPEHMLPQNMVSILNNTYIDAKYLQKDRESLEYKKKQMKKRLYRQQAFERKKEKEKNIQNGTLQMKRKKKQEKALQKLKIKEEVDKEFAEAEAVMSNKELIKHTSSILQQLFYVYFKILVHMNNSKFLRDALDGILKFAHMINIDLIFSLVQHLDQAAEMYRLLWKQTEDSKLIQSRLMIIFAAESVLNGPLSMYNMDDLKQVKNLYKTMRDINSIAIKKDKTKPSQQPYKVNINRQIFRLVVLTIQQSLIKRRQLSQQTVGSIVRELAVLVSRRNIPKAVLLDVIRLLGSRYNKVTRMFEQENQGFGINSYIQLCQDPQSTNAINTSIVPFLKAAVHQSSKTQESRIKNVVEALMKQNMISATKDRLPFDQLFEADLSIFSS